VRRRLVAGAAALVLALLGTVVLLSYVRGADARALAGTRTVDVVMVTKQVPAGTPAEQLPGFTALAPVPAAVVASGAITDLASLTGRVAAVTLEPGEQVLGTRFVSPDQQKAASAVTVPAGMITTTVQLEPQRALGGKITAGDTVGVSISQKANAASLTNLQLRSALVTAVQGAPDTAAASTDKTTASEGSVSPAAAAASTLPSSNLLVTLALAPKDAERLVWGAEHGTLWLSAEPAGTPEGGTQILDGQKVYQ